jgi:hypothetical protein
MKDETRSPSRHHHQLDHALPTVIHNPEEDMPLLARWLRRAMANQTRFWSLVVGLVVVVTALAILSSGLSLGRSTSDTAWIRLETAKTPSEREEIAREYPKTQAEQWALLQAATEYYNQGFSDLPANRDAALPALRKALDLFDEVAREAPQDSPQARAAALGAARTLEARNELDKAIKQYEKVAATWKGTPEAAEAQRLVQALRQPESAAFYKELYAYKPVETTLPPGGQGSLSLPPNHPPIGGATTAPTSSLPLVFPSTPPPGSAAAKEASSKVTEPPSLLLPPPPPPPPPTPTPKAETPGNTSAPGLPADVFTPEGAGAKDKDKTQAESPKERNELPDDPFAPKD